MCMWMQISMYSHMQLLFTKSSFPAYFTPVHTSKLQRPVCSILVPFLDVHSRGNVRLSDLVQVVQQPALCPSWEAFTLFGVWM